MSPVVRSVLTLSLVIAVGCSTSTISAPTDDLRFRVAAGPYTLGDTVDFELRNETTLTVGYNLCSATLERRAGDEWDTVPRSDPVAACLAVLYQLAPGETATASQAVGDWMPGGTYRFRDDVVLPTGEERRAVVVTNEFSILR